jgi:hypothetical protein
MRNIIEIAFKISTVFLLISGVYLMSSGFKNSNLDNQVSGGMFFVMGLIFARHSVTYG